MSEANAALRFAVCLAAAALVATAHLLLNRRRHAGGPSGPRALPLVLLPFMGLALAGAVAFGAYQTLEKIPALRPIKNDEWLFWAIVLAPTLAGLASIGPKLARAAVSVIVALGLAALASWLTLGNAIRNGYSVEATPALAAALGGLAIALPWLVAHAAALRAEPALSRLSGGTKPAARADEPTPGRSSRWSALPGLVACGMIAATLIGGMFYSRYVINMEIAATMGMAIAAFAVARLLVPGLPVLTLVVGLTAPINALMWLTAFGYASAPLTATVIGVLAPLAFGLDLLPPIRRRSVLVRTIIVAGVATALGGAAVFTAAKANRSADDLYGGPIPIASDRA